MPRIEQGTVAPERLERDALVFSHRLSYLDNAMITLPSSKKLPKSSGVSRDSRPSSLGKLDRLPLELLHSVLGVLDFQSLARLSCVSRSAQPTVEALQAWRELVNSAPQLLEALSRTQLLSLHSAARLQAALRSELCVACPEFGAYLFLPTCERCCWECLRWNPRLRVISLHQAGKTFGLSQRHLRQLPVMRTIPGRYGIAADERDTPRRLVSAKTACELGILVHGSAENLTRLLPAKYKTAKAIVTAQFLQRASSDTRGDDLLAVPGQGNIPPDCFFGMASVPFPSLTALGTIETGLWCRGCHRADERYQAGRLTNDALESMVPRGFGPQRVLLGLVRRARSRARFLEHVKHCYGAQHLVRKVEAEA